MRRKVVTALVILLSLALPNAPIIEEAEAATSTPTVNRVFYMLSPNLLSTSLPPPGSAVTSNLTASQVRFKFQTLLLSEMTISGHINFSLWINATFPTPPPMPPLLSINGTFTEKRAGGETLNVSMTSRQSLVDGVRRYNFTGSVPATTLLFGSEISVSIAARPDRPANVTLLWGSSTYPSLVILPLSAYLTLSPEQPVEILDSDRKPKTSFDLNSTNNVIFFRVSVFASFGLEDIQRIRVNLTIVDSTLHPARGGANLTMLQFPPATSSSLSYTYITSWAYPSTSSQGTYQVYVDIIGGQKVVVFSFRGPATFTLTRELFPQSLIPYLAAGGVGVSGVIGGFVYFRRRKSKSYLAPFDHFYSLSGGPFASGSMVMIEGNTGSGKSLLAQQLMYDDLRSGKPCVFVSTADFPSKIRGAMKSLGFETDPYEGREYLRFVDCYSAEAGQPSQEKFYISSLSDLTSLGVKITSAISNPGEFPSVFFDSLTPLTPKSKPESIVSFAQAVGAKVRGVGGKAYFTVGSGTEPSILRNLEESSDCVIQMEAFEEKGIRRRRMRISKFRNRRFHEGWVTFTVEDGKGIIFYSKKPKR